MTHVADGDPRDEDGCGLIDTVTTDMIDLNILCVCWYRVMTLSENLIDGLIRKFEDVYKV